MSKKHGKRHSGQPDAKSVAKASQTDPVSGKGRSKAARSAKHRPPSARTRSSVPAARGAGDPAGLPPVGGSMAGIVAVRSEEAFDLASVDPDAHGGLDKVAAGEALKVEQARIRSLQERLYAEHRRSLLVVFQAIDTGGKDGTIRSVFGGVNPQGCRVWSFKVPSSEESDHDFLWRYHAKVPGRGMIGVFNRSHYEDVLVVRVKNLVPESVWRPRYDLINDFERMLALSGVTVLKVFLHISKDEQKERLEARIADPQKHWKFDAADLVERQSWDAYQAAFSDALGLCSTPHAPWLVVPANRKWSRNLLVARAVADALEAMDPQFPEAQPGISGLTVPG